MRVRTVYDVWRSSNPVPRTHYFETTRVLGPRPREQRRNAQDRGRQSQVADGSRRSRTAAAGREWQTRVVNGSGQVVGGSPRVGVGWVGAVRVSEANVVVAWEGAAVG
jgi:hypothetical protein